MLAIGQSIPLPSGPRRRPPPIPLDVSRALEQLFEAVPFDIVHVHEPFAPSPGSAALRHSPSLNVATFHEPAERVLSTQVARMLVEMFFGRIDARTASNVATAEMLERFFPGPWEVIRAGRRRGRAGARSRRRRGGSASSTAPRRSGARCACSCARCAACPRSSTGRA